MIFSASSSGISVSNSLFERHHELDRVQRVGAQVVDERRFVLDLRFVDAELLGDDLLDSLLYVFHASPPLTGILNCTTREFYQIGPIATKASEPVALVA